MDGRNAQADRHSQQLQMLDTTTTDGFGETVQSIHELHHTVRVLQGDLQNGIGLSQQQAAFARDQAAHLAGAQAQGMKTWTLLS